MKKIFLMTLLFVSANSFAQSNIQVADTESIFLTPDITITKAQLDVLLKWLAVPQTGSFELAINNNDGNGFSVAKDTATIMVNEKIKFVRFKKALYKIVNGQLVKVK